MAERDMRPVQMISNRGTACTMPAHMASGLLDRGYTMVSTEAPPQSGAITSADWQPGASESDGTMNTNPFA